MIDRREHLCSDMILSRHSNDEEWNAAQIGVVTIRTGKTHCWLVSRIAVDQCQCRDVTNKALRGVRRARAVVLPAIAPFLLSQQQFLGLTAHLSNAFDSVSSVQGSLMPSVGSGPE